MDKNVAEKKGPHPINKSALRRLSIIEGQIKGIQKMIEEEKYCIDILNQISAVRSALNGVGKMILRRHIDHCFSDALRNNGDNAKEMIDEIMAVFSKEEI